MSIFNNHFMLNTTSNATNSSTKKEVSFPNADKNNNNKGSLLQDAKPSLSNNNKLKNANKEGITGSTSNNNNKDSTSYDSAFAKAPSYNRRSTLEHSLGSRGILCGIKNIGATCYAASLLQTMFVTPELRSHVICFPFEEKQRHKDNIAYQLQLLFAQMQGKRKAFVDPTNLLLSFNMGPGAHTQQHDVQELNRQLVDVIQGCIDRTPKTHEKNEVIQDLYRGLFGDVKKCQGCNSVTFNGGQVFLDLQIPIANMASLDDALQNYVKFDVIEGARCDNCEGPQNLEKGAVFESFPKVFSIHLLRFDFNMTTFRREKVESDLDLPITLDVNKLIYKEKDNNNTNNNDDGADNNKNNNNTDINYQYEINAVICHRGTPFHGHYYCFVRVSESEEQLEQMLYGEEGAKTMQKNKAKKPQDTLEQDKQARELIGGTGWIKFDDDTVTIADPDEVLSYVSPSLWKSRREEIKKEKEAKDEEERKKREEQEKKDKENNSSNNNTDAAAQDAAVTVIDHPLAAADQRDNAAAVPNASSTSDDPSKQTDEEAIADIFNDAFGGMVESSASSSSKTNYDHLTKVSGHSYYVLYRRKDIVPSPLVNVADVFPTPVRDNIPDYVRSIVDKEENELAEKAKELETLKDIVSVAIWDEKTKKRTWVDATEETTIAELTKMAYEQLFLNNNNNNNTSAVSQDAAPPSASASASASSATTVNNTMPAFDPSLVRLRKYSTSYNVGGATFSNPEKETLASLGFKKTSSQHGNFLIETRNNNNNNNQWKEVRENDISLRVAKLTKNQPKHQQITDYDRIVLPADSSLLQLFQKSADFYKFDLGNTQCTLKRDGDAIPMSVWEAPTTSSVNMGKQADSNDGFVMGLFSDNNNNNGSTTTSSQLEQDAKLARELSGEAASQQTSSSSPPTTTEAARKPFYRDLVATTLKHLDLAQDDIIYVEEFLQFDLPSDASELRSKLIAVELIDYQYLIKVFWSVSGYDGENDLPNLKSLDKHEPIYVDKRKNLLHLKEKVCSTLGIISSTNNKSNSDTNTNIDDLLAECQMLLDGGVREPKNLASTMIRSATYGMPSVNVEIRKGRPLQESECFVTVFRSTDDFLKNPIEQVKRILIKADTTLHTLAEAAFDVNFPNEGACAGESEQQQSQNNNNNTNSSSQDAAAPVASSSDDTSGKEKSVQQAGGGSTRVTSVCINGQHYRPRLMPFGTNIKSLGTVMYKREVKANLTHAHVADNSEIRVVFQPIDKEEALTKNSLLLRFIRWNALAPDVVSSLALPGRNIVLPKDGELESILKIFAELSPEIPSENIEFGRCRAYQMRSQENICNDLMWLSKSFLDMESGKRRTLCGHPMKLESDEFILFRDSDESWPQGTNVQFGFSGIQSNSQQKDILSKSKGNGKGSGDGKDDDSKNNKKNKNVEKGISLKVVWDREDDDKPVTKEGECAVKDDDINNNNDDNDNDSTKADKGQHSRQNSGGAADDFNNLMSADEQLARSLQEAEDGNNNNNNNNRNKNNISSSANCGGVPVQSDAAPGGKNDENNNSSSSQPTTGGVGASVGVADSELINFVPHEPYGELMKISLPTTCCVCFCDFEDGEDVCVTKCHHIIHRSCLAPWLSQEFSCPQCKTSLW